MKTPLIDKDYLVQKQSGKGGWSYVVISEIPRLIEFVKR
jgi:hypothetical protein